MTDGSLRAKPGQCCSRPLHLRRTVLTGLDRSRRADIDATGYRLQQALPDQSPHSGIRKPPVGKLTPSNYLVKPG